MMYPTSEIRSIMEFSAVCKKHSAMTNQCDMNIKRLVCNVFNSNSPLQDKTLTPVFPDNVLVPTSGVKQSKKKSDMLPQNSGNKVSTYAMQHPRRAKT